MTARRPAARVAHALGLAATLAGVALAGVGMAAAAPAAGGAAPANRFGQPGVPIDVSADSTQVFQTERRIVYIGSVEALQGTSRLRTPQLTIFYNNNNAVKGQPAPAAAPGAVGAVQRMEAEGPVYFVTPTQSAKGDHGSFDAASDTITLVGNVVLTQDRNVSSGEKLVINQKTGEVTLSSGARSGRVRGVFYNDDKKPAAPGAAAGPAPAPRP